MPLICASSSKVNRGSTMGRLLRAIIYIVVILALGLAAFAYLGDLSPDRGEVRIPVEIDAN